MENKTLSPQEEREAAIAANETYGLNCDKCGSFYVSLRAFPKPQLCPQCLKSPDTKTEEQGQVSPPVLSPPPDTKSKKSHEYNRKCHGYDYHPLGRLGLFLIRSLFKNLKPVKDDKISVAVKCDNDTKQGSLYCPEHGKKND